MADEVLYHISEQHADALIKPIHAELRTLEDRTRHYTRHLRMSPEDRELIESTREAIRQAREETERLHRMSTGAQ